MAHRILLGALCVGAVGTLAAWVAMPERPAAPVGVAILGIATVIVWAAPGRVSALLATVAALVAFAPLLRPDGLEQLAATDGVLLAFCRAVQAAGVLVAAGAGLRIGLRRRTRALTADPAATANDRQQRRDRAVAVGTLVVLSAIGAELLAAYNDTTGRPAELAFNVVFFAMLYGCPALLVREAARRTGRSWPTMMLLGGVFGLVQAGVIDQALFADSYGDVRGWDEDLRATYVAPLGLGASMALNFVLGHVVFSFCAPIAVVEAMRPSIAHRSWLTGRGMVIAAALWLAAAGLIFFDALGSAHHATPLEVAGSLAVSAALTAAALRGGGAPPPRRNRTPRVRTVLTASFVATTAATAVPETWLGVAVTLTVAAVSVWLFAHTARGRDWSLAHTAAVGTGALVSRGALAFLYYPVVGETSAGPKYAHNVVMLLLVVLVSTYAIRAASYWQLAAPPSEDLPR